MKPKSLRGAINAKCKDCIYDTCAPGTWRQQVAICSAITCPLYDVRPKPTVSIPGSILSWYGINTVQSQPSIAIKTALPS